MTTTGKDYSNRMNERLDVALPISIPDQKGETINISATGVYFEVITDDIDAFFPGTIVPIQIWTSATTPGFETIDINLKGKGTVVRNDIRDGNRLGVALEFKEKLDFQMV